MIIESGKVSFRGSYDFSWGGKVRKESFFGRKCFFGGGYCKNLTYFLQTSYGIF